MQPLPLPALAVGSLTEAVGGRRWEPDEVRRQVLRRVARCRRLGIGRGDRVLLHFGNSLEFFAELLAAWSVGACVIPVDSRLTAFEVERLAEAAAARFSIVDDGVGAGPAAGAGTTLVHTLEGTDPAAGAGMLDGSAARLDDDALILFTSGSTGQPKGVVHTHRSLEARWASLRSCLPLADFARTLCVLPTHFGHGLICNCLFPWLAGCELVVTPPFRPELIMQLGSLLDSYGITFMSSVPSLWNLALRAAPPPRQSTLRRIHIGSAPLSAALWSQVSTWGRGAAVVNAYGITETGSWVAGASAEGTTPADGLIGQPWGAVIRVMQARAVGDFAASAECGPGEEGMLWLRTPALMRGYFQRDDLTDAVVFQGWFMTGDIGVRDAGGQLRLRGRERDEVNKGGMKVFPADIEAVAARHAGVLDACAFAVEDPAYGENVAIALVLQDAGPEALRSLHAWLRQHLAEHKQPVRWFLLDEIPRTSRGKVDRRVVKDACATREPLDLREPGPAPP